ncbi:MFS transporter [Scopulibacillus cellulosilyticus]|uniref:MFS transporter n=1 Tax=Scopulibacillus cellulosilyticus TaxID=2665665 RepID=A0ABW2PXZ1_9BACL
MIKRYSIFVVVMLFLANAINYLDRSAFSVAVPYIKKSLDINAAELGIIMSVFFVGYAIFNFIGGYLSDKYGPRKIFAGSMTLWSIFCGLTITAFNFVSLFVIRLLFGFGEGPLAATTNKTVNNWVPKEKRARATGIAFSGSPLGGAIAGPIVGFIAILWNWKISFIVITLIGIIWAIVWYKFIKDKPRDLPNVSEEELKDYEPETEMAAVSKKSAKTPLTFYLKQPTILCTAIAFFAYNFILYFFTTWFPGYLSMERHLNIESMSIATSVPWIVGFFGLVLSGTISDFIYKKTGKLLFSRKVILVSGLLCSAVCIGLTGLAKTAVSAVILMALGIFFMYITGALYWAVISDTVEADKVGGASGFVHTLANISGIIAPSVTGFIVQFTGSFTSAFLLAGALALIGAVCVWIFVKPFKVKNNKQHVA